MSHALGWKRDAPHQRPPLRKAAKGVLLSGLPLVTDLSTFDQGTSDQGPLGACTGVSAARAIQNRDAAQGIVSPVLPSALSAYFWARYLDWIGAGGAGQPFSVFIAQDSDTGSSHTAVCNGIRAMGLPPESAWAYDPTDTGTPTDKYRQRPTGEAERLGFDQRGLVTESLDDEDVDARVTNLVHALASKQVVCIGVDVDEPFVNEAFNPEVPVGVPTGKPAGGHALYIVGHKTAPDGTRAYKVHMSWGPGDFAYVWFSEPYVLSGQLTLIEHAPSFPGGAS